MSKADFCYLNGMVVEQLNLLMQASATVQLPRFAQGDQIRFSTY